MFENWQPFWDVLILISSSGILTLWLYLKERLTVVFMGDHGPNMDKFKHCINMVLNEADSVRR